MECSATENSQERASTFSVLFFSGFWGISSSTEWLKVYKSRCSMTHLEYVVIMLTIMPAAIARYIPNRRIMIVNLNPMGNVVDQTI